MRVRIAGHSLHPILVAFPIGLLATSLAWDICYLATGNPMWGTVAFWSIIAGLIGGLLAAIPGFVDWLGIPSGTRARRLGAWHLGLNLGLVALFVLSALLRWTDGYSTPAFLEMLPGWIGLGLMVVSGWLGGELVERLGVAVYEDANLDAPSSLRSPGRGEPSRRTPTSPRHPSPV